MIVEFSARAEADIEEIARWWSTHRDVGAGLFFAELEEAEKQLRAGAKAFRPWDQEVKQLGETYDYFWLSPRAKHSKNRLRGAKGAARAREIEHRQQESDGAEKFDDTETNPRGRRGRRVNACSATGSTVHKNTGSGWEQAFYTPATGGHELVIVDLEDDGLEGVQRFNIRCPAHNTLSCQRSSWSVTRFTSINPNTSAGSVSSSGPQLRVCVLSQGIVTERWAGVGQVVKSNPQIRAKADTLMAPNPG